MKKLNKLVFAVVIAMFAFSVSPLMENNNTNVANAATKRTTHHKKGTKKARYAKIRRRGNVYVTTFSGGYYYKDAALKHPAKKRGYKAGKTLRVKRVVLYHGLQRYQLTNGSYITAYHADFNYHYTYKRVAKKMVNHETIIKAKKARKAKKAKKNNNEEANKKQNNNVTKTLLQGKMTESVKAPTDANADPYAGKHNEGDMWYQESTDDTSVVATFKFTNGNWKNISANNGKNTNTQNNSNNTVVLLNGKLIESTNAPTDANADPYAGKHNEGDSWFQESADKKTIVAKFTYTNNNWKNNSDNSNSTNDNSKNAAEPGENNQDALPASYDIASDKEDYAETYSGAMDKDANLTDIASAVDSNGAKLGLVAAKIERQNQGTNYNPNTPAPSADFSKGTVTINNVTYDVNGNVVK